MNNRPPHPRLRRLVDRLHDGPPLSKPEVAELEDLLEDDAALAYYLEASQQEALMASVVPQVDDLTEDAPQVLPFPRALQIGASLVAACVIFGLGLHLGRNLEPSSTDPIAATHPGSPPARITGMVGVEWTDEKSPHRIELDPSSSEISIESGLVEVTYASGVCVTLEGPAVYEVEGHETGRLQQGKLYTTVPKGAEGFKIHYAGGIVEDLGTEFAMDALPDGSTEVGVFSGMIKLHSAGRDSILLYENQSLVQSPVRSEPLQPIPLDRKKYVTRLPARDFRWEVDSSGSREVTFDVTHLVWKPAKYRAIFKWISGPDAVVIRDVRLLHDGEPVAVDAHEGSTGMLRYVSDNIYALDVEPGTYSRGRWTVVATLETLSREGGSLADSYLPLDSRGILQFEEGLVTNARPDQFIGRWAYRHLGDLFVREFRPDGSVSLTKNGEVVDSSWTRSQWWVENGVLNVTLPKKDLIERHVLRDPETLIFTSNQYDNATKEPVE